MSIEDIETAIRASGCGWDQLSDRLVATADETPGYCNEFQCLSLAAGAARSGTTPEDVGVAALALVNGDRSLIRDILAPEA